MKSSCLTLVFLLGCMKIVRAQPYLDIATVKYQYSPDAGIVKHNKANNAFQLFSAGIAIPLVSKKDSSVFLLAPFADYWKIDAITISASTIKITSVGVPLTVVKPINAVWTATLSFIPRWNGAEKASRTFQAGGVILTTYKKSDRLKYKGGLYYNNEFFGHFFMPLLGIDYTINNKLRLFGVLPGSMTLEKKVNAHFYYGLAFKAITNSFKTPYADGEKEGFLRIDDNQLSLFADVYVTPHLVANAELGHSFFRQYRKGYMNDKEKYFFKEKADDNVLLKVSLLYRMRF